METSEMPPEFLCGVIEGFYNRPWTHDQRLQLFKRMQEFGLNCYLYAPKDDHKHRSLWRVPYTAEEIQLLKTLIDACHERGLVFVYGISPGVDITYSSPEDLEKLQAKVSSIQSLGCKAFALLWDDIDIYLPANDLLKFNSLAEAHVKVTNQIYEHLGRPLFLTCPVEYCANRSEPNVKKSEYLSTLGNGLDKGIDIFWTGSQVVSEIITKEEILFLQTVLKRRPIIWDNLHANDYDHQRIFLGPYSGRCPDIIPHLKGVMLNPNCEYSLNIPALFTLAQWSKCFNPQTLEISNWDSIKAAKLAVKPFQDEIRRPTNISIHDQNVYECSERERPDIALSDSEVELLFHYFWLPHSNGPKGELLVNEFKYLRDHSHILHNLRDPPENFESFDGGENEFHETWIQRAIIFNTNSKGFSKICDKFTFIANRELFFDINSYLNNLQIILSACNRYLRWAGIEKIKKPIRCGPTLAGLPGGISGDFQRLYPIHSNYEYPMHMMIPIGEKNCFQIQPIIDADEESIKENVIKIFCECQSLEPSTIPKSLRNFILNINMECIFKQPDCQILSIECDEVPAAYLFFSRNVKDVCKALTKTLAKPFELGAEDKVELPRYLYRMQNDTLPLDIPWTMIRKSNAICSFVTMTELVFTKIASNLFQLQNMILADDSRDLTIIIDKSSPTTRLFLLSLNFIELHQGDFFIVMKYSGKSNNDEVEAMEDE